MSDVNANDLTEIRGAQDVAPLYLGAGKDAKAGLEVEMAFFNPKSPGLDVMSLAQNKVLKAASADVLGAQWVHNEPTSELLEVSSIAARFDQIRSVLADINQKISVVTRKAQGLGLKRSYFQELPDKTADDLLSRIVDVPRYRVMYAPYREDMKKTVQYFAVCKSNQVSVSYRDQDHGLENVRRLYFLAPFLFLLTDNSTGFNEGKRFKGHAGMSLRHHGLPKGRGGIIPHVFEARTGTEFFERHIDQVMNNPLYMYYDLEGRLVGLPSGTWITFNQLKEKGLNTASNYFLAQSVLWPDIKIAALRDETGGVYGHRYEARMFGVGIHQHQTALLLTSALAFHDDFSANVDELLAKYGFDAQGGAEAYTLLQKGYKAAREHNGKFFDIPYGKGKMSDFAKEFAILVEAVSEEIGFEDEFQPLLTISRTGCTDAKVNCTLFPTLEDVLKFQRTYDAQVFDNHNIAARTAFSKELERRRAELGLRPGCCG